MYCHSSAQVHFYAGTNEAKRLGASLGIVANRKKSCPCQESNPGCPAYAQSLYTTIS